jgi:hypothetical protein
MHLADELWAIKPLTRRSPLAGFDYVRGPILTVARAYFEIRPPDEYGRTIAELHLR